MRPARSPADRRRAQRLGIVEVEAPPLASAPRLALPARTGFAAGPPARLDALGFTPVCITTLACSRRERAQRHFAERGLDVAFFNAVDAQAVGLATKVPQPFDVDHEQRPMHPKSLGIWLAHRSLWAALLLLPGDVFMVMEDDCQLAEDWRPRMARALHDLPSDWGFLFAGSCCLMDKRPRRVRGDVHVTDVPPMCLHCYLIRRAALPVMIAALDVAQARAPIDIITQHYGLPESGVYSLVPRLAVQDGTFTPE